MSKVKENNVVEPGAQIHSWLVLHETDRPEGVKTGKYWWCRCSCGLEKAVCQDKLRNGGSKMCPSCSCRSRGEDLTGKTFGSWLMLHKTERPEMVQSNRSYYLCCCNICGFEKKIRSADLRRGRVTKCDSCEMRENLESMSSKTFGRLTVVRFATEEETIGRPARGKYYFCDCECGKTYIVSENSLKTGNTKSCGCLKTTEDLSGKIFGSWHILHEIDKPEGIKGHRIYWLCECMICGITKPVEDQCLKNGESSMCRSCMSKKMSEDLTGQKFGLLTVLRFTTPEERERKARRGSSFLCLCQCGVTSIVSGNSLKTGGTKSCGCIKSFGEKNINLLLKENNIAFKQNRNLKDTEISLLQFDFIIYGINNYEFIIVEFDGKQHYEKANGYYSLKQVDNDIRKNRYCLENNIPLYRIPYEYRDKITLELLTSDQFRVTNEDHYGIFDNI